MQLFGILLKHDHSSEAHWLQAGLPVMELLHDYCSVKPLEEWKYVGGAMGGAMGGAREAEMELYV